MVMRTDLIPWSDFPENQTEDLTSEKLTFLGETRNDGWRCEGACVNTDGITCKSFLVWITFPDRSSAEQGIFFIEYGLKDGVFSEIQHPVSVPDDIKFVVLGINILVLDMLTAGIWAFVRLCRWAGRENTEKRTIVVVVMILMGLFAASVFCLV